MELLFNNSTIAGDNSLIYMNKSVTTTKCVLACVCARVHMWRMLFSLVWYVHDVSFHVTLRLRNICVWGGGGVICSWCFTVRLRNINISFALKKTWSISVYVWFKRNNQLFDYLTKVTTHVGTHGCSTTDFDLERTAGRTLKRRFESHLNIYMQSDILK